MSHDRLTLKNMIFYGYHGVFAAEKELGQRFEVDVDLFLDLYQSGSSDDLDLSINYVEVYTLVKDIVEERQFNLVEALAETIAGEIIAAYPVDKVGIRVRKPSPPGSGVMDGVEVEIKRQATRE